MTRQTVNMFVIPEVTLAVSGKTFKRRRQRTGIIAERKRLKDGESRMGTQVMEGGDEEVVAHAGSKIIVSGSHYAHIV